MLYMLRSFCREGRSLIKIGYASDNDKRFFQYKSHNPGIELIATRQGEEYEETKLHLYFSIYYKKYRTLNEWYIEEDREDIEYLFHKGMGEIDKEIWKNRDTLFKRIDFIKDTVKKKIYEELLGKYGTKLRFITEITEDKIIIPSNSKDIDRTYYNISLKDKQIATIFDSNLEYQIFLQDFGIDNNFERRMRLYCDFIKKFYNIIRTTNIQGVPQEYQNYMNLLGPDRIKTLRYYRAELEREYKNIISGDTKKEMILNNFQISQRYTLKEIKEKLREIYQSLGITKTAKAKDIEEYYEVKRCVIPIFDKRLEGLEVINIKS